MVTEDESDIKTQIALIKRDIKSIENFFLKFEKIAEEINTNTKIIAVYESKFDRQEEILEDIRKNADLRQRESENSVREIKQQIMSMEMDISKRDDRLTVSFANEISEFRKTTEIAIQKLYDVMSNQSKKDEEKLENLSKRVSSLENWKWYLAGIGAIIMFLMNKLSFIIGG